ncbi:MAG: tetratricopeptide repeat protein, partial [Bacteroidota bacterium]
MKKIILASVCLLSSLGIQAQLIDKERSSLRQGNRAYESEDYATAAAKYQSAIQENAASQVGMFNLGDAMYEQKKFEESARYFDMAAQLADDKREKSKAYHNLGNAFMAQEKYKESVEAYKQALRNDPQDHDTK